MILGVDTSNYKCSISLLDGERFIVNYSKYLKIKHGALGLRQSDAFFQHIQILEDYLSKIPQEYINSIKAIGVSDRPRRTENSYMPVFKAGVFFAETLARGLGINSIYRFSHQEGHYGAAIKDISINIEDDVLFFHVSGGTSELLTVKKQSNSFCMENIVCTSDLSFGQIIDRIGLYMGFDFPCGMEMEKSIYHDYTELLKSDNFRKLKNSIPSLKLSEKFNLSGYENKFKNLIERGYNSKLITALLFVKIAEFIIQIVEKGIFETSYRKVVLSGGVMANSIIREVIMSSSLFTSDDIQIYFSPVENCGDSAIGPAFLTKVFMNFNKGEEFNEVKD